MSFLHWCTHIYFELTASCRARSVRQDLYLHILWHVSDITCLETISKRVFIWKRMHFVYISYAFQRKDRSVREEVYNSVALQSAAKSTRCQSSVASKNCKYYANSIDVNYSRTKCVTHWLRHTWIATHIIERIHPM